jgi:hypothetical protein
MKPLARVAVVATVLAGFLTGCKSSSSGPNLVAVKGTVNLDGKPMEGGEIRFIAPGQPAVVIEIKSGAFSGKAPAGKNTVEVVWDQDGPANPMDPSTRIKVNTVSPQFSGPNSTLSADVPAGGASDLKFDVTSARR